jgi:membrane-bound lytic murein transglycosylase D
MIMGKGKYIFLILAMFVSVISLCGKAQNIQSNALLKDNNNLTKQNPLINFPDSLSDKSLNSTLSNELDSLVSTWYVKNAFNLDSLSLADRSDTLDVPLSDSVYVSRLKNIDSYISLPFNDAVKKIINFYTNKRRAQVSVILGLSAYYFPLFEEVLEKYNLPHELKYLPIIESALNPKAISRVRASGLWQFMYSTAKLYGLEINSFVDERFDPIKSTEAACHFLSDLYDIYRDWHLVIAAYNCGPGNINKAIHRSGGDQNYWDIYYKLPRETRAYIPTFIAATYVMNYAKEHRLTPTLPSFKIQTDTIELHDYYRFEQISANLNISIDELRQLNPQYRRDIIPAKADKPYILKLPLDKITAFIDNQPLIYAYNRDKYFPNNEIIIPKGGLNYADIEGKKKTYYIVRTGDNPGSIAQQHHISVANLRTWNNIRHDMIRVGQRLAIYVPDKGVSKNKQLLASVSKTPVEQSVKTNSSQSVNNQPTEPGNNQKVSNKAIKEEFTYYTVRSGDSIYTIAKQFNGVSDAEIIALNQIKDINNLIPGQKLKIPVKVEGI